VTDFTIIKKERNYRNDVFWVENPVSEESNASCSKVED
jgi:hypothetical protein